VNCTPPPDVFSLPYTCSFIVIEYKIFAKVHVIEKGGAKVGDWCRREII
jgi:hypothetical protein